MIQKERIKVLNKKGVKRGTYIFYCPQASQRAEYNHAQKAPWQEAIKNHDAVINLRSPNFENAISQMEFSAYIPDIQDRTDALIPLSLPEAYPLLSVNSPVLHDDHNRFGNVSF